jgi:ubiquinone/menaquinone biosynthesis C-methylase UbiE
MNREVSMHERRFDPARAHLLENPERRKWLPPHEVMPALHVRAGETAVDIGAGTGYFAVPMAAAAGPGGRVFAVDVSAEMLGRLRKNLADAGVHNVECVEGSASSTGLDSACADLVFMANVWHEFDDHDAVLAEGKRLLKRGGRLALLDWRPDGEPEHGPPMAHRISASAAKASLEAVGLTVEFAGNVGQYSWMLVGRYDSV